jgi:hypothetical protein
MDAKEQEGVMDHTFSGMVRTLGNILQSSVPDHFAKGDPEREKNLCTSQQVSKGVTYGDE